MNLTRHIHVEVACRIGVVASHGPTLSWDMHGRERKTSLPCWPLEWWGLLLKQISLAGLITSRNKVGQTRAERQNVGFKQKHTFLASRSGHCGAGGIERRVGSWSSALTLADLRKRERIEGVEVKGADVERVEVEGLG